MPASPNADPSSGFVVDDATYTLRFERDLTVSPTRAFKAWTLPEQVAQWWDAAGDRLVTCEIDLRIGGAFTFISKSHPHMAFTGVYEEITPPNRLVFEAMAAKGVVTLQPNGSGTHMVVEIICGSAEMLEQYKQVGVAVGTSQTLDNLVGYVSQAALAEG
jgi:uncharacterized protein YndB with AHSA1/START domain